MDPSWILAELPELQITQCDNLIGAVAQLGEHLLCKQGVTGSIPVSSTKLDCSAISNRRSEHECRMLSAEMHSQPPRRQPSNRQDDL
jgi:hypothetical protein